MVPSRSSEEQIVVENAKATASPRNGISPPRRLRNPRRRQSRPPLRRRRWAPTAAPLASPAPPATFSALWYSATRERSASSTAMDYRHRRGIRADRFRWRVLVAAGPTGLRDSRLRRNQAQPSRTASGLRSRRNSYTRS